MRNREEVVSAVGVLSRSGSFLPSSAAPVSVRGSVLTSLRPRACSQKRNNVPNSNHPKLRVRSSACRSGTSGMGCRSHLCRATGDAVSTDRSEVRSNASVLPIAVPHGVRPLPASDFPGRRGTLAAPSAALLSLRQRPLRRRRERPRGLDPTVRVLCLPRILATHGLPSIATRLRATLYMAQRIAYGSGPPPDPYR